MPKDLVLYSHPMSRGRIARWMLEEIGADYCVEMLDYGTTMKAPDYLAINPMGKVPALRHGDAVVTEAAAICAYLADAFPEAGMAPPAHVRAAYYRWLFFAAGPLENAITARMLGATPTAEQRGMVGFGTYEAVMDALEGAVSAGAYLAGEQFSAADVYVGAHIGWGMEFGTIERRPAFEAYWGMIADRPAHRRASALDDAAQAQPAG